LVHRRVPVVEQEKFKLTLKEGNLTIDMPEETFYVEGIQIAKRGIAIDIQKFVPELDETKFVETFKAEPKPEAPKPVALEEKPVQTTEAPAALTEEKTAKKAAKAPKKPKE
jgi:peptidylprolyl isomerase